jgi:hypothetical protein
MAEIAQEINPIIRGWLGYYGRYTPSALGSMVQYVSQLLKRGFEIAQSSVAKSMVKRREPPSQGWRSFLHNHAREVAAMDFFVVPTIGFDRFYRLRYRPARSQSRLSRFTKNLKFTCEFRSAAISPARPPIFS